MATQKPKRRVKRTTKIAGYSKTRTTTTKKSGAKTVRDKSVALGRDFETREREIDKTKTRKTYSPSGKRKTYRSKSRTTTPTKKSVYKVKNIRGKITEKEKTVNKSTGRRTKTVERHGRRKK